MFSQIRKETPQMTIEVIEEIGYSLIFGNTNMENSI